MSCLDQQPWLVSISYLYWCRYRINVISPMPLNEINKLGIFHTYGRRFCQDAKRFYSWWVRHLVISSHESPLVSVPFNNMLSDEHASAKHIIHYIKPNLSLTNWMLLSHCSYWTVRGETDCLCIQRDTSGWWLIHSLLLYGWIMDILYHWPDDHRLTLCRCLKGPIGYFVNCS